jgi:hypothetical protein
MRIINIVGLTAAACCLLTMPAWAQKKETPQKPDKLFDQQLQEIVSSTFLTIACDVPQIMPLVPTLKRSVKATDADALITKFFGSRDNLLGNDKVISPLWGPGTRYKSGMVLSLVKNQELGQRSIIGPTTKTEVVPVFLDVYPPGFVYINNVSHTAVHATSVKPTAVDTADISHYDVYDVKEGQQAAEGLITELFGQLKVPAGFQTSVQAMIQTFGERLFAYRVVPQYITKYELFENRGDKVVGAQPVEPKVTGTQPVAIPVYDVYVNLQLDGEKMLAGIEYYWDGGLTPVGEPKRCISAPQAILNAREGLLKQYNNQPPLLTVASIRLGFIQDRGDRTRLVPAWLFDAWYTVLSEPKQKPNTELEGQDRVDVPLPFAVNALTGAIMFL